MVKIIVMECHLMNITLPENERELDKKTKLGKRLLGIFREPKRSTLFIRSGFNETTQSNHNLKGMKK